MSVIVSDTAVPLLLPRTTSVVVVSMLLRVMITNLDGRGEVSGNAGVTVAAVSVVKVTRAPVVRLMFPPASLADTVMRFAPSFRVSLCVYRLVAGAARSG